MMHSTGEQILLFAVGNQEDGSRLGLPAGTIKSLQNATIGTKPSRTHNNIKANDVKPKNLPGQTIIRDTISRYTIT